MKRKIRLGLDFDGVVAYNPFRLIRAPITFVKRNLLGKRKLNFYYPKNEAEKLIWKILHDSSILPSKGIDLLEDLIKSEQIEAHIISGRYNYLEDHLVAFLDKHKIKKLLKTININKNDKQPHMFKEEIVNKLKLDYFIEDNLDIVLHLNNKSKTKIIWIYNLIDKFISSYYPKYPYLEKALHHIIEEK